MFMKMFMKKNVYEKMFMKKKGVHKNILNGVRKIPPPSRLGNPPGEFPFESGFGLGLG